MSKVFRYNLSAPTEMKGSHRLLRKRKTHGPRIWNLVSADSFFFRDESGKFAIDSYRCPRERVSITLTRREANLIALANPGEKPPIAVEDVQRWIPQVGFCEDVEKNWQRLREVYYKYGHFFLDADQACARSWNKVCNTVRRKTDYDARFYAAWHLPIQDSFAFSEERSDRRIIAIDFNSMYPACMLQEFPDPSSLTRVEINRDLTSDDKLIHGLYRCILHPPASNFMLKYTPFRSFFAGRYLGTIMSEPIEIDLNEFEVEFYSEHFARIELIEALVSQKVRGHPLARDVLRAHARRKNFLKQGNKPLADREKMILTLLASSTHRPRISRHSFGNNHEALSFLKNRFGINLNSHQIGGGSVKWLDGRRGLLVVENSESTDVSAPDLFDGSACFEYNQRIVARSRITLLRKMADLDHRFQDLEVCYANIDSLHLSVPLLDFDRVMCSLNHDASFELGSFKVEAVSQAGLWIEPGRYWLYSDKIDKFRNRGMRRGANVFVERSSYVSSTKIGELFIPVQHTTTLARSISSIRKVLNESPPGFARQALVSIGSNSTIDATLDCLEQNRKECRPIQMRAFQRLKHLIM